jgi:VWFA-related protein
MRWPVVVAILLLFPLCVSAQGVAPGTAADPGTGYIIRTDAREVVVDLIVRTNKGEPVRDLIVEEVKVLEANTPQQILSFRKVEGGRFERLGGAAVAPDAGAAAVGAGAGSQMRMAQLVSLVFERLGNNARQLAFRAARDFIRSELRENVYVAVYVLDRQLYPLLEFTNDRDKLEEAIKSATGRNRTDFYTESALVERRLQEYLAQTGAPNLQQGGGATLAAPQGAPNVDAMLARRALDIAQYSQQLARDAEAGGSIFSLIALVRRQADLVGRKTVLLFSEGFHVPTNYVSHLDGLVSEANRAQVSFYTIDARGLQATSQLDDARQRLQDSVEASRSQQEMSINSAQRGVTRDEATAFDAAQDSIRSDRQGTLQEIAERTGGDFIGNTNSFTKPLLRLTEDIFSYYEVTYRPPWEQFDGSFRPVAVAVSRPEVEIQTRDGYYALPPAVGDVVTVPFEMPLMAALAGATPPQDLSFNNLWLEFRTQQGTPLLSLATQLTLSKLQFDESEAAPSGKRKKNDAPERNYSARFSILLQLKDENGVIVKKVSQDVPLRGDAAQLDGIRQANFVLYKNWEVEPGEYTLEAAIRDQLADKYGASKTGVVVEAPKTGIGLSDLALIRRLDEKPAAGKDAKKKKQEPAEAPRDEAVHNPLEFQLGTVIPATEFVIPKSLGGNVSYYFVVYPDKSSSEKPTLLMEYYLDGQLVGKGAPELPAPQENGWIPYIATTPASAFPPGEFTMKVIVAQGGSTAQREAFFKIVE